VLQDPEFKALPRPAAEKRFFGGFAFAVKHAWFWNLGVKIARSFLNRKAERGFIRKLKGPFQGWFQSKDLPAMAEKTFHERWKEMEKP
jgi:hypothetical protein